MFEAITARLFNQVLITRRKEYKMKTQKQNVLNHIRKIGPISQLECTRLYGSTRLAAIIHNLRKEGYTILTDTVTADSGARYGRYFMPETAPNTEAITGQRRIYCPDCGKLSGHHQITGRDHRTKAQMRCSHCRAIAYQRDEY